MALTRSTAAANGAYLLLTDIKIEDGGDTLVEDPWC